MAKEKIENDGTQCTRDLIIAKERDVLFLPRLPSGRHVLQVMCKMLQKDRERWIKEKSPGKPVDEKTDLAYLRALDPVNWKDQDHYAVLGLKHLRFRSTEEDIKKAYRFRALRHHPDKRQSMGEKINLEGDYFACIVRAYEILGNAKKRCSYDSVDPHFDDYTPPKVTTSPSHFFTAYGDWFELNSRWSVVQPAPLLGNMMTSRDKVDEFYGFWYNFDSWREYSYLNEEEKINGSDREERRWIEKNNKAAQATKKKQEMSRIRSVVDNAYSNDPRVAMFKEEDNRKKMEKKQAKLDAAREKKLAEENARREEEERAKAAKEKLLAEEREKESQLKRKKEVVKKAVKREKKMLRSFCKENNYFSCDNEAVENMTKLEHMLEVLSLDELENLNKEMQSKSFDVAREIFIEKSNEVHERIEREKVATACSASKHNSEEDKNVRGETAWSSEEIASLVKAVNIFPAGTNQRWEVVANFIHQHCESDRRRSAKEVLSKAKELKSSNFSANKLKVQANESAFDSFVKSIKQPVLIDAESSIRDNGGLQNGDKGNSHEKKESSRPWTADEQKLLEQALKTYPATVSERWDKISTCVPTRSKQECMARFKELAALIKAKRKAQHNLKSV